MVAAIVAFQLSTIALANPPIEPRRDAQTGIANGMAYRELKGLDYGSALRVVE